MENAVELPRYKCHKGVRAAKVTAFRGPTGDDGTLLVLGEIGGYKGVSSEWMERFEPELGGYLVFYDDGYMSFSPAKAFEEGYTRI